MSEKIKAKKTAGKADKLRMEALLSKVPNRFVLSVGAARRGRQILEGANPLVQSQPRKLPILTALKEIQGERVKISLLPPEEE